MQTPDESRERLTQNMMDLDTGLQRIVQQHERTVTLEYEDPLTFGAGHFVLYAQHDSRVRFVIDEQYTGTGWWDDERVPTSWTWSAERYVPDGHGAHIWGIERDGETPSAEFGNLLIEAEHWVRRVENRAPQHSPFGAPARRQPPPARSL